MKSSVRKKKAPDLEFNHAMIYVSNLHRSVEFYGNGLGFILLETYPGAYARLKSPSGSTTIALHVVERGQRIKPAAEGMRLYFEVRQLSAYCKGLAKRGVNLDREPKKMPWGWTHAYLRDPDGHEISLYRAGSARLRKRK